MSLDLGGIAKGYAADEMLRTLTSHGLTMALIDAGGDIVVGEPPPGSHGWLVQVSTVDTSGRVVQEDLRLTNAAVASSGDTYRYLEIGGVRYSHILDPATGYGITVRRLVTAVARSGIEADALASAISVMGCNGLRLAEQTSRRAWVIEVARDGNAKSCGSEPNEFSATNQINLLSQTNRK
jgi:thiamine biosynthesis lipoprotein